MIIIQFLLIGLILSLLNIFLFEDNMKASTIIKNLSFFIIALNFISLGLLRYFLRRSGLFTDLVIENKFSIPYIVFTLLIGAFFIIIKAMMDSKIVFEPSKCKESRKSIVFAVLSTIFIALGALFFFFSRWFIATVGEITPEQFLFNFKSPLTGTSEGMTTEIITTPVFQISLCVIIFLAVVTFSYDVFFKRKSIKIRIISKKQIRIFTAALSVLLMVCGVTYGVKRLKINEIISAYFSSSPYFEDNYTDPRNVAMQFPEKKRNLIHIYLESMENSYLSKDLGGNMDENIMPELTELAKEGVVFSDSDKPFGGPYQTYGSSWSVAGMVNMTTGMPLKIPINGNSYGTSGHFYPGAITIGDVLYANGYNQTIMFGADADFGGLTTYFTTHGSYNIFDLKAAKEKGLIPPDYNVWWGFEDDKLYEYAKAEITRLYNEGKPFNFTMETADTHFPDGYVSENNKVNKFESQYANVIAYSTKEAVDFVRWIQAQPFYEDTTIVITGDHLSMDTAFFENFDPNYRRSVFNLILNAPVVPENRNNRKYTPFDMCPTILAGMGIKIDGNRFALGTNLFSGRKTLLEDQGYDELNSGLQRNSNFFNDEIINERKNHIFDNKNVTVY